MLWKNIVFLLKRYIIFHSADLCSFKQKIHEILTRVNSGKIAGFPQAKDLQYYLSPLASMTQGIFPVKKKKLNDKNPGRTLPRNCI